MSCLGATYSIRAACHKEIKSLYSLLSSRGFARAGGSKTRCWLNGRSPSRSWRGSRDRSAGWAAPKGWRWAGEMEEIAQSMAAAGLPDGFTNRPPRSSAAASDGPDQPAMTRYCARYFTRLADDIPMITLALAARLSGGLPVLLPARPARIFRSGSNARGGWRVRNDAVITAAAFSKSSPNRSAAGCLAGCEFTAAHFAS
jgi:hypothetical protein